MAPKTPSVDITVVTKNLRALHGALEHSLTIQRTRLQEIVDDLVARGSLSRSDADGLVNQLLTSSRDYSQALLQVLDSITADARKSLGGGIAPMMATAGKIADTVRQAPRLVAKSTSRRQGATPAQRRSAPRAASKQSTAKKTAKKTARSATAAGASEPIPGYSSMTVAEIKPRLSDLSASALRRVRDAELAGKARKSVLGRIDELLGPRGSAT